MSTFRLIVLSLALAFVAAPSQADEVTCDPTLITDVIELAHMDHLEIQRGGGPIWIDVNQELASVRASAIHVKLTGGDCTAVVDTVRVRSGGTWRRLRVAGNNVFATGYFGERFPVERMGIELDVFLLQTTYCDITVNALIYADVPPFLRPFPYPDPDC